MSALKISLQLSLPALLNIVFAGRDFNGLMLLIIERLPRFVLWVESHVVEDPRVSVRATQ